MMKHSCSRVYDRLLSFSTIYLYGIIFMIASAIAGVWWFCFYGPMGVAISKEQEELNQLYAHIAEVRKIERTLIGISQSIDTSEDTIKKQNKSKLQNFNSQESLALVIEYATNAGMHMNICKILGERIESYCSICQVMAECIGSLDQIIAFFELLKKSPSLIIVPQYELMHSGAMLFSLRVTCDVHCVS